MWRPTYKLSMFEPEVYVNKNNQAPSYTDRVLYKDNTAGGELKPLTYEAYHDVLGSDHRPVVFTFEADLPKHDFCELNGEESGYLRLKQIKLLNAKFDQIPAL